MINPRISPKFAITYGSVKIPTPIVEFITLSTEDRLLDFPAYSSGPSWSETVEEMCETRFYI